MPTPIEWCDETFNPWWGCERVSPACAHCYADTFARRIGMPDLWSEKDHRDEHGFRFFADPHWDEPLKWARKLPAKLGRRPRVFCASMADVFEDRDELKMPRDRLFDLIWRTQELDWLILTKRPEFARDELARIYAESGEGDFVLPNVWLGVSIENARFTWRADVLREIPAAVRFISAEPLLGSLFQFTGPRSVGHRPLDLLGIDWVIIGGESGPKARPFHLEHAREIIGVAQSRPDGPTLFVKQLGARPVDTDWGLLGYADAPLKLRDRKGGDVEEWPPALRIREFPRSAVPA